MDQWFMLSVCFIHSTKNENVGFYEVGLLCSNTIQLLYKVDFKKCVN